MNHDLIEALIELYKEIPQEDADSAARRLAVLIERHMAHMEQKNEEIDRPSLLEAIKASLAEHHKKAA